MASNLVKTLDDFRSGFKEKLKIKPRRGTDSSGVSSGPSGKSGSGSRGKADSPSRSGGRATEVKVSQISRVSWHASEAFHPEEEGDGILSFEKEERFMVVKEKFDSSDYWCMAARLSDGNEGWVPRHLLKRTHHKLEFDFPSDSGNSVNSGTCDSGMTSGGNSSSANGGEMPPKGTAEAWDMRTFHYKSREVGEVLRGEEEGAFVICKRSLRAGKMALAVCQPSALDRDKNDLVFYFIERTNEGYRFEVFPKSKPFKDVDTIGQMCAMGRLDHHVQLKLIPPNCTDLDEEEEGAAPSGGHDGTGNRDASFETRRQPAKQQNGKTSKTAGSDEPLYQNFKRV